MKSKTKILLICLFLFICYVNAAMAQEKKVMQHKDQMPEQHEMMDMKQMGSKMDSCKTKCDMMMGQMKQMDAQSMMGGQKCMDSMMGTTKSLSNMADQMKIMSQNMEKMMNNKELMKNPELSEQMKQMHEMMSQTTNNLTQMSATCQKMMEQMQKQPVKK